MFFDFLNLHSKHESMFNKFLTRIYLYIYLSIYLRKFGTLKLHMLYVQMKSFQNECNLKEC